MVKEACAVTFIVKQTAVLICLKYFTALTWKRATNHDLVRHSDFEHGALHQLGPRTVLAVRNECTVISSVVNVYVSLCLIIPFKNKIMKTQKSNTYMSV